MITRPFPSLNQCRFFFVGIRQNQFFLSGLASFFMVHPGATYNTQRGDPVNIQTCILRLNRVWTSSQPDKMQQLQNARAGMNSERYVCRFSTRVNPRKEV